tara:strand:- start:2086 stop:2421 length:336 start_codon:yes stop_codon:yes gene_type:complete
MGINTSETKMLVVPANQGVLIYIPQKKIYTSHSADYNQLETFSYSGISWKKYLTTELRTYENVWTNYTTGIPFWANDMIRGHGLYIALKENFLGITCYLAISSSALKVHWI